MFVTYAGAIWVYLAFIQYFGFGQVFMPLYAGAATYIWRMRYYWSQLCSLVQVNKFYILVHIINMVVVICYGAVLNMIYCVLVRLVYATICWCIVL